MTRILVAYATFAGSTVDVAQVVGEEIAKSGWQVDILPIDKVTSLEGYDGVVVGGPMIMGWHRAARKFLKRQRAALQHIPLAVFVIVSFANAFNISAGGVCHVHESDTDRRDHRRRCAGLCGRTVAEATSKHRALEFPGTLRPLVELSSTHREGNSSGSPGIDRSVWRSAGVWTHEVVGHVVRHLDRASSRQRSAKLDSDPGLGGQPASNFPD